MPVLPFPMIISLVLFVLLAWRLLTAESHVTLLSLIAVCATQSAIIALVQYYGLAAIRPIQPLLATCIPPIAWFAFSHAAGGSKRFSELWPHALGPLCGVMCLLTKPELLDVLIPLSFSSYGVAMLWQLSRGEDSLPHSALQGGALPLIAWRIIAASLIASAGCDIYITYSLVTGGKNAVLWMPSLVSSLVLLSLGILSLSQVIESHRDVDTEEAQISHEDAARDLSIIAKLDYYVATNKPFLDPDLTLSRLSRKLVLPAKQLSTAINRVKGENVSRYINRQRVEEACRKLAAGQSVTAAMLDSGFNTKSNFNREFLRVTGVTPRRWKSAPPQQG